MNKILSFGSINFDLVYTVPHIVLPGETISSSNVETFLGGKGFNQAGALKKAGADVWLGGQIGTDGDAIREACQEIGIHTDYLHTVPGKTGHAVIQVDARGENSIFLFGGANQSFTPEFVEEVLSHFGPGDYLLVQNEVNLLPHIVDTACDRGMTIFLNPSPYSPQVEECCLDKISWFLINEVEGQQITGETEPDKILHAMHQRFPKAGILLTLGKNGARCLYGDTLLTQRAVPANAVDTTAAGDTFTGYFISSLCAGRSLPQALALSAAAAALCVTRPGAFPSIPTLSETQAWMDSM